MPKEVGKKVLSNGQIKIKETLRNTMQKKIMENLRGSRNPAFVHGERIKRVY